MLEKIDLSKAIEKSDYKNQMAPLQLKLGEVQREARQRGIPVIVVFEGWDAAGKGTLINKLIQALDPRGLTVYPINAPTEEERLKPFLWRFWIKTPSRGRLAVFDRSWYRKVLMERVEKVVHKNECQGFYNEIRSFERQLADDGNVIIKFFLHISKKEQKKRFEKIESNPATAWKVTKVDWKHHKEYENYLQVVEEMLEATDTAYAPWTIVEAHDERFATVKAFQAVVAAIEDAIHQKRDSPEKSKVMKTPAAALERLSESVLDKVDLSVSISKSDYEKKLEKDEERIREIEYQLYIRRIPLLILYEGWDAAGKGGNIRRLTHHLDPRGYEVVPIAAPNDVEKSHHYLWRFWTKIPKAGHIAIFDRTWYGRVLVERVEGFCAESEWKRAYREINEMEEQWVNFGMVIVKFWLQIDKEEQLKRFKERGSNPHKQWKITEEDWRNRKKWGAYKQAVDEMLIRTSTAHAPWTIVESNDKHFARVKALKTVIQVLEKRLKK